MKEDSVPCIYTSAHSLVIKSRVDCPLCCPFPVMWILAAKWSNVCCVMWLICPQPHPSCVSTFCKENEGQTSLFFFLWFGCNPCCPWWQRFRCTFTYLTRVNRKSSWRPFAYSIMLCDPHSLTSASPKKEIKIHDVMKRWCTKLEMAAPPIFCFYILFDLLLFRKRGQPDTYSECAII